MDIIEEIINILSSEEGSITNALIKTKVLLFRMGEKELTDWVNNELTGYKFNTDVPKYRKVASTVMANSLNYTHMINEHEVPLYHLKKEQRIFFEKTEFRNSIASLEDLAKQNTERSGAIQRKIPIEYYSLLNKKIGNDYVIQKAWCSISRNSLLQIITEIRSRLLDFVLELEEKIPNNTKIKDLKTMSKNINTKSLFNNSIIGDNATIVLGNNNNQNINNKIEKNDFKALTEYFKNSNISDKDIEILEKSIENDKELVDFENQKYGPNVKEWVKLMLGKAVETTWNIEIGVASSLIATGINSFYGWF